MDYRKEIDKLFNTDQIMRAGRSKDDILALIKKAQDEARQEALEEVEEYIHRHVIEVDEVQEVIDFIESELKSGGKDD